MSYISLDLVDYESLIDPPATNTLFRSLLKQQPKAARACFNGALIWIFPFMVTSRTVEETCYACKLQAPPITRQDIFDIATTLLKVQFSSYAIFIIWAAGYFSTEGILGSMQNSWLCFK